jgi:integrase
VTRSLHQLHTGEYVIRPPKTEAGKRVVKLTQEIADMLRRHRAQREAQDAMYSIELDEQGLIFANVDGSHIRPDYVSLAWRKFTRKCGLQGVRLPRYAASSRQPAAEARR